MEKIAYSVEEAAKALGIGRNNCYERIKAGEIPSVQVGKKRLLVPKVALDRYLLEKAGM